MPGIDWSLAHSPANIANSAMQGFEQGVRIGTDLRKRKALNAFAADPDNPEAIRQLIAVAPDLGFKAAEYQREQAKAKREQDFGGALSEYLTTGGGNALLGAGGGRSALSFGPSGPAAPNALAPWAIGASGSGTVPTTLRPNPPTDTGALAAPAPDLPGSVQPAPTSQQDDGPDLSSLGTPRTGADHAFLRMVRADPLRALKIRSELRDNFVQGLKDTRDVYDLAYERLGETADEASYQRALVELGPMVAAVGGNIADHVPPSYPGPAGIQQIRLKALTARQQVSAFMSQANIDEDNERADRNTDSLIADRGARRGEARRYHDVQAGNVRRGQDIRSGDTRRGQDLRGSGGGRGGGAAAAPRGPVPVKSRAEAMKLPPGTEFRTPDGAVLRVPSR